MTPDEEELLILTWKERCDAAYQRGRLEGLQQRRRITVPAQQRARQIADRMSQLPLRLHWEQHRDDLVLVLLDEIDFDDE